MSKTTWPLATRENPCVVCGSTHNCRNAPDGTAAVCWHNGNGGKAIQLEKPSTRTQKPDDYGKHAKPQPEQRTYLSAAKALAAYGMGKPDKVQTYRDAHGRDVLAVGRWNKADGKKIIRPVGNIGTGWIQGDPSGLLPLYNLPEIRAADPGEPVYIHEGEKAADAGTSIGLFSTTSAHGSGSAAKTDWGPLAGRPVAIFPDNDDAGEHYRGDLVEILSNLDPPATVRVVRLPGLPVGGDIVEYLEALDGKEPAELRAGIMELVANTAPEKVERLVIESAAQLIADCPELRPVIIACLMRACETVNLIAPPKSHKTFLALYLAVCVAIGRDVFGVFPVENPGPVLYIDCELHRETFAKRLAAVCTGMGVMQDQLAGRLDVLNLRGRLRDLNALGPLLRGLGRGRYCVIVLDALYRLLPADVDENSNADITRLYNLLDQYAAATGAAFIIIHHASKGVQGGKAVTDVGSGAGAQSRAADAHVVLRQHEEEGAAVFEAVVRSFPPQPAICLRWEYPVWKLAPDLNPKALKIESRRRKPDAKSEQADVPAPEPWTVARLVAMLSADPLAKRIVISNAMGQGLSQRKAEALVDLAIGGRQAFVWRVRGSNAIYLANREQLLTDLANTDDVSHVSHTRTPPHPPRVSEDTLGRGVSDSDTENGKG